MSGFEPRDPAFEARIRGSFARQRFMRTLGAELSAVRPGEVVIALPFSDALTQQHGFLHAGAVSAVVDSACGYAALSLMPPGTGVLSVEFKVNMLAPAAGRRFEAVGRVRKAGRTITVCEGELRAFDGDEAAGTLVALMQGTMMTVRDRPGFTD
ncbi:MAG TPA: PaaI family thioesterase [Gemmatimonadaceae bacterium]